MVKGFCKQKGRFEVYKHENGAGKKVIPVSLASCSASKPTPEKYEYDSYLALQLIQAGRAEHIYFKVPTVPFLDIHNSIAPEAIICAVKESSQKDLFAKPDIHRKERGVLPA